MNSLNGSRGLRGWKCVCRGCGKIESVIRWVREGSRRTEDTEKEGVGDYIEVERWDWSAGLSFRT